MKRILVLMLAAAAILCVSGCSKKTKKSETGGTLPQADSGQGTSDASFNDEPRWTNENGVIAVLFGEGFNDGQTYGQLLSGLTEVYGLDTDGGLLHPLHYPDDFKNGKIDALPSMLEELRPRGLILLGAPDKTSSQLLRFASEDGTMQFPVFSFFPLDNNRLAHEYTCVLVLEYERSSREMADSAEVEHVIDEQDAEEIAYRAVREMATLKASSSYSDAQLKEIVQRIAGEAVTKRYVDDDTNLPSQNHYVLEKK